MTSELSQFGRVNRELNEAIVSGRVSRSAQKAVEAYDEGVKDYINGLGFVNKLSGVMLAAFAPVGMPFLVSASVVGAVASKIGIERDFKKGRK